MQPILFIHIPKTAGTSFNENAEKSFGSDMMEKDYGAQANHTSALVKEYIYGKETIDQYGLHQAFKQAGKKWLTGHFNADRYLPLLGCENTLSFVRDPVDRVISEYLYRKRQFGMERSLEAFYQDPGETNKQFRMIGEYPWQAFRFVGTQARYQDCLAHLNNSMKLGFENIQTNRRKDAAHLDITAEDKTEIRRWNQRDCIFYDEATAYLEKQFTAASSGKAFCYHNFGFEEGKHIIGWAFYLGQDTAAEVGLFVEGQHSQTTRASEYLAELHMVGAPRAGNVGFRFVLSDYADAKTIELKAMKTDQSLFFWQAS